MLAKAADLMDLVSCLDEEVAHTRYAHRCATVPSDWQPEWTLVIGDDVTVGDLADRYGAEELDEMLGRVGAAIDAAERAREELYAREREITDAWMCEQEENFVRQEAFEAALQVDMSCASYERFTARVMADYKADRLPTDGTLREHLAAQAREEKAREGQAVPADASRRDLRLPVEVFPYKKRVGKSVVPVNHSSNYVALLQRSGFEISYDVIQKEARVSIHGRPLPKSDHEGEVLLRRATDLCELNGLSTNGLQSTLTALMAGNQVNPVLDYLTSLEWGGKPRFDALAEAVGASDAVAARAAFRIFLLQACAAADGGERGMWVNREALPKYETVLVLQGEQGVGKTSGLRRLLPAQLRA
ncbi:MAG TPA: VapE domain-containing protein, partial [Zeimonas sp.]|nr:VapE domain-containing protein [Zeimonas sp.]